MAVIFRALTTKNLQRVNTLPLTAAVETYMDAFMQGIIDAVKPYPPEREESTYQRRGMAGGLLGSWEITTTRSGVGSITKSIINTAVDDRASRRYMVYVQGRYQYWLHQQTGWQRVDLAALAVRRQYVTGLQAIYSRFIIKGP